MSILLRKSVLIPLTQFVSALITGAMELLIGETQGYAIDATSINNRSYIGGPDGGEVACRDTSTPANDLSNVPLDSSNLTQSGTSPKIVNWNTFSGPHNLLQYSEDFTTVWDDGDGSTSANTTANPLNGTVNADTYTQGATTSLGQFVTLSGTTTYAWSIYVKAGTATWLRLAMADAVNEVRGWFNVSTGATGSVSNTSGDGSGAQISAISVGGGWYRVTFSGTGISLSDAGAEVCCVTADANSTRDTGKTLIVWGGQLNIGSTATDYVPTTAVCSGGVRWTPHNMLLQSQTIDNASWTKTNSSITANATTAPDNSLTADKLVENGTAGVFHLAVQDATVVVGFAYTFSVYAKAAERTLIILNHDDGTDHLTTFDLANGVLGTNNDGNDASIAAVGNGWYRCSITNSPTATTLSNVIFLAAVDDTIAYNGNGTSGAYIWGAQLNRGPVATPYLVTTTTTRVGIPQGYDVANSKFGMLIEPAATNLLLQSENFSDAAWDNSSGAATVNSTTAPDGSLTADTWTATGVNGSIPPTVGLASGTSARTVSVYAKKNNTDFVKFGLSDFAANAGEVFFNLTNGNVGSSAVVGDATINGSSVISVGNGWYRLSVTVTFASSHTVYWTARQCQADGGNSAANDAIYLWGAQSETDSVATSYIPTVSATSTRAVDNVSALTSSIPYSQTTSSVYCDFRVIDYGTDKSLWNFFNAATTGRYFLYAADTIALALKVDAASVSQANITIYAGGTSPSTRIQAAVAAQTNNFASTADGMAVGTDVSGTLVSDITTLRVGANHLSQDTNAFIHRLVYVPRRVIDADLPTWRYNYP